MSPFLKYQSFDDRTWNSYPKPVRALRNLPEANGPSQPRWDQAKALADQGFQIDVPIMVWGWTPTVVADIRGLPTTPPPPLSPDLVVTGQQPFGQWSAGRLNPASANGDPGTFYAPNIWDESDPGAVYPNADSPTHQKQMLRPGSAQRDLPFWVLL